MFQEQKGKKQILRRRLNIKFSFELDKTANETYTAKLKTAKLYGLFQCFSVCSMTKWITKALRTKFHLRNHVATKNCLNPSNMSEEFIGGLANMPENTANYIKP